MTKNDFLLLAALLRAPYNFLSKEEIIDILWPEDKAIDKNSMNNRISVQINKLRHVLKDFPEYTIKPEFRKGYRITIP